MDYTQIDPYSRVTHYSHLQPQNPNPNPNPHLPIDPYKANYSGVGLNTGLRQPGIESYSSLSSYAAHSHGGTYAHHQTGDDAASVGLPSLYYPDRNGGTAVQNWAVTEAVKQYAANPYLTGGTVTPYGTEQLVPAIPNSTLWSNPTIRPHGIGTWKRVPKKTKIVQSAWCEVCKLACNSKDVLDKHKLGKKHMSNLEKLTEATAPAPVLVASAKSANPVIGPQENPAKGKSVSGQIPRKKAAEPVEDLETKRKKIVEGGAAAAAVRTCAICNVVCNSATVFNYHLAGQKHIAMMKKYASGTGMATAT